MGLLRRIKSFVISNESERSSESFTQFLRRPSVILSRAKNPSTLAIIFSSLFIAFLGIIIFRSQISTFFQSDPGEDPIAYWNFDEGTGSTVYDSGQGQNDGNLGSGNSAPTWVTDDQCISGKCLRFDGTDDYVQNATSNLANVGNAAAITISLWVKPISTSKSTLFTKGSSGSCFNYGVVFSSTTLQSRNSNNDYSLGTALTTNKWNHIGIVYDSAGAKGYINGTYVGTQAASTTTNCANTNWAMGARAYNALTSEKFKGYIDEVKIYNYDRSAAQIKADYASRGTVRGVAAQFGDDDLSRKLSDGLVGYWKMDEVGVSGSAWTVLDSSGNNNNGTGAGNATVGSTASGKFGNAGYFDGTDDSVRIPETASTDLGALTDSYSVSAWFKYSTCASNQCMIVGKDAGSSVQFPFMFTNFGNLEFQITDTNGNFSSAYTTNQYMDGVWHQLVGVRDMASDKVYLYVDAILVGTGQENSTSTTANNDDISIGNGFAGYAFYDYKGQVDEVRLYNRALDPSEVKDLYNFAPGPVAHWKMDEGIGSSAADTSGNAYTGALGSGSSAPIWTQGKFGNALLFDGTSDYIDIGDTLNQTGDLTLSAWIKSSDTVNNNYIVSKYRAVADERGYALITTAGKLQMLLGTGSDTATSITSNANVTTGSWVYVAGVIGSDNVMKLYINGTLDISANYTGTRQNASICNVQIGAYGDSDLMNSFFHGNIDDVKIFNYARTQAQIVSDMNAGHPAPGSPVGSAIAHYKLDEGYGRSIHNAGNAGSTLNGTFGTGASAPTWTNDGKFGKGLMFDGSSDYVNIPSSTAWNLTDFTLSSWVYITAGQNTSWNNIIRKDNYLEAGTRKSFSLRTSYNNGNDKPELGLYDGTKESRASSPTALTTGWHHIVGVRTANSSLKLYVNGNLMVGVTDATVGAFDNVTNITLGGIRNSAYAFGEKFKGTIDEVKIYNFALTADQVKVEYNQGKAQVMGALSTGLGGTSPSFSSSREYCVPGDSSTCNAPVGEWLFNEGIGTSANDTTGGGYTGTLTGSMTDTDWVQGKFGKALDFDGVNDFISIADNNTFSFGNGTVDSPFSISAWVHMREISDFGIVSKRDSNDTPEYHLSVESNSIIFYLWDDSAVSSENSLSATYTIDSAYLNKWTNIAVTYDGSSTAAGLKMYINNQLVSSSNYKGSTYVSMHNETSALEIGRRAANDTYAADGKIDQVRIYNYVRTPAQVAWEYNQGKPVAYYKLDECTGTTIKDWGQNANGGYNGNTGTLELGSEGVTSAGTCSTSGAWANGVIGKRESSLSFDGSDDYINLPTNVPSVTNLDVSGQYTFSTWIKANANDLKEGTAIYGIYEIPTISTFGILATVTGIPSGDTITVIWQNNGLMDSCGWVSRYVDISSNWTHISFRYDGSQSDISRGIIYINGKDYTDHTPEVSLCSGTIADITSDVGTVGTGSLVGSDYFSGQIDEVKIFNYPLTPAQIKTEMAGGAVRFQ